MSVLTTPFSGLGTTLGYKVGSATVFTSFAQLKDDWDFAEATTADIETATISTVAMTRIPGRQDYDSLSGTMYFIPGDPTVAEAWTLFQARTMVAWQVMTTDGTSGTTGSTLAFSGYISSLKPGPFTGTDAVTMDFKISINGTVTLTTGS